MKFSPPTVNTSGTWSVLVPTIRWSKNLSEMHVPEMVRAGPKRERVVPGDREMAVGFAMSVWPAMVRMVGRARWEAELCCCR